MLPEPTGQYAVGKETLHLTDDDRPDPWKPETGPRELMTSLWYPSVGGQDDSARYMPPEVSALSTDGLPGKVPPEAVSSVRTESAVDAPPRMDRWPLIILSPGFSYSRATLTGLAEELASQGFIVAAVDHTYEAPVRFPDDRVTGCATPAPCAFSTKADLQRVVESRAKDVSFVLDELTGPRPSWSGAEFIDSSRIGMAGHSLGGAAAAETMVTDSRVDAGVNMDGTHYASESVSGLDRPFLFFGNGLRFDPAFDPSWEQTWPQLSGWKRTLLTRESGHASFTDLPLLVDQLGIRDEYPPESARTNLGSIPSERSTKITRDYLTSFFELHLKDQPTRLFDEPSPEHPEVVLRGGGRPGH